MKFLVVLLVTSLAVVSVACTCLPNAPPTEALAEADSVFTGQVVRAELIATEQDVPEGLNFEHAKAMAKDMGIEIKDGKYVTYSRLFVFLVKEGFKGAENEQISVVTEMTPTACGFDFILGRDYLVYAYNEGDRVRTSICTRTKELGQRLSEEKDELETLRTIARATAGQK